MRVTRAEALDGVRRARVGRMATITPEGRPHVVPFVFVLIGEDPDLHAYWVVDRKQRRSHYPSRMAGELQRVVAEIQVAAFAR